MWNESDQVKDMFWTSIDDLLNILFFRIMISIISSARNRGITFHFIEYMESVLSVAEYMAMNNFLTIAC